MTHRTSLTAPRFIEVHVPSHSLDCKTVLEMKYV